MHKDETIKSGSTPLEPRHSAHWFFFTYPYLILRIISLDSTIINLHIFLSLSCSFLLLAAWRLSYSCCRHSCHSFHLGKVKILFLFSETWHNPEHLASQTEFWSKTGQNCLESIKLRVSKVSRGEFDRSVQHAGLIHIADHNRSDTLHGVVAALS